MILNPDDSNQDTDPLNGQVSIGGTFNIAKLNAAVTYGHVIHFRDRELYGKHLNDPKWMKHWHMVQEDNYFHGHTNAFLREITREYCETGGHDNAPLEIDAQNHAGLNSPWKDPWEFEPFRARPAWLRRPPYAKG